jgi:hypothetical protein
MKKLNKTINSPGGNETKSVTPGVLIAAAYAACGDHGAPKILQLAIASNLVRFKRSSRLYHRPAVL